MASLINVEKAKYINDNIAIYGQNKIGQYSKFLNKNPIFVTYYHINQTMSRGDVGTGGIESELGASSPIRFNKINNFPVYNIPELKPDINYDESGYDIELDLTDITILPGTIKPIPGSYMILSFPGIKEFLFRVTAIRYNTIQSNDFYIIDLDIKDIGLDLEKRLSNQIVETYETIFDNIGTKDNCFIRNTDIDKINDIVKMINILKENYKDQFYSPEYNSFILRENPCNICREDNIPLYDLYLEKFIMESKIYYEANNEVSLILTPNDIISSTFQLEFKRSFLNAVLTRSMDYINKFTYFYQTGVRKSFSPFNLNHYFVNSTVLYLSKENLTPTPDYDTVSTQIPEHPNPLREYFSISLIEQILNKELTSDNYIDKLIYNYFNNIKEDVDRDNLLKILNDDTWRGFTHTPVIVFILNQYYNEYFKITIDL